MHFLFRGRDPLPQVTELHGPSAWQEWEAAVAATKNLRPRPIAFSRQSNAQPEWSDTVHPLGPEPQCSTSVRAQ